MSYAAGFQTPVGTAVISSGSESETDDVVTELPGARLPGSSHGSSCGDEEVFAPDPETERKIKEHRERRRSLVMERFSTVAKKKRRKLLLTVGDKVALDDDREGVVHFIGPVQTERKGLVESYGIDLSTGDGNCDGTLFGRRYFFPTKDDSGLMVQKRKVVAIVKPINGKRIGLRDRVRVKGRKDGEVKFIGPTLFGPFIWFGVELDNKIGRHNGMVQGIRYFEAKLGYAVFVREDSLTPLDKDGNPKQPMVKAYAKKSTREMAIDLFEACAKGDLKTVRAILHIDKRVVKFAVDPNTEASALMTACYHGYYLVAAELLATKLIEVNEVNYHGLNALHFAAQAGYDNIVELLCKDGADVDICTEDGITALYIAVEKGHERVVRKLIQYYADVNLSSKEDESPMMQACHRGAEKIVKLLMGSPTHLNVNQRRKTDGATAMFIACREGHTQCVKALLKRDDVDLNRAKANGRSPLFISSFFGRDEIVKLLLEHSEYCVVKGIDAGSLNVDLADTKGFTPLFVAAQNGHTQIVKRLLEAGGDVNLAEARGHTPLWIAGLRGHLDVVRILLAHPEIDIDRKDLSGVTALWAACQNNNVDVVELLLHPRDVDIVEEKTADGHRKKLSVTRKELFLPVDMGAMDLGGAGAVDDDDLSALLQGIDASAELDESVPSAGRRGHGRKHSHARTSSRVLWAKKGGVRKGADPNVAKHDGCTPLWIAASRGNAQCMRHLIAYGADLDRSDLSQGATPLFVACQNGKKSAVDVLLEFRANVNIPRSGDGTTPLMMAAHNGHTGIVEVLLKSGANPLQANATGLNALGCAAMQGHHRIVKLCYQNLLETRRAEDIHKFVNKGDQVNGWTPLHLACMGGHSRVIKFLVEKVKVDIFKKDYENKTALEHAWTNGHQNIVAWLSHLEGKRAEERLRERTAIADEY